MLIGRYAAVLDACVLHPSFLRGSLLWLAKEHLFRPLWSNRILDEWERSLVRKRPDIQAAMLARHRKEMLTFEDAMVGAGNFSLTELALPDPNDRHVIETALMGKADAIITANLKHFPHTELAKLGIEPIHPDSFLVNLIDLDPMLAIAALKRQRENMTQSQPSIEAYLGRFERCGLFQTRAKLAEFEDLL